MNKRDQCYLLMFSLFLALFQAWMKRRAGISCVSLCVWIQGVYLEFMYESFIFISLTRPNHAILAVVLFKYHPMSCVPNSAECLYLISLSTENHSSFFHLESLSIYMYLISLVINEVRPSQLRAVPEINVRGGREAPFKTYNHPS
jgi:hypothetical protein